MPPTYAANLAEIVATPYTWSRELVANISSRFHHLVNTGLAVGSLDKWLPIKVDSQPFQNRQI